ncbi:MAG: hypothetical protein ACYSUF_14275 [Planctomycetota bacterium]
MWTVVTDRGTELWGTSVDPALEPRRLVGAVNTVTLGIEWMPDGRTVVCGLVPPARGAEPEAPRVPRGPNTQETSGEKSPLRTYQDLLSSPHAEALFEHFAVSQPVLVSLDDGRVTPFGKPALYKEISPSPDGRYLLVARVEKPFSYQMPWWGFPHTYEVWNADGRPEHVVARIPAGENIPIGGVRTGPRMIQWESSRPATLVWAEALDGGDPKREVPHRDRWLEQAVPFQGKPRELFRIEQRATGLSFFGDPSLLITREYDRDRRWTRSLLHNLDDPGAGPDGGGPPGRAAGRPVDLSHRARGLGRGHVALPRPAESCDARDRAAVALRRRRLRVGGGRSRRRRVRAVHHAPPCSSSRATRRRRRRRTTACAPPASASSRR